MKKSFLLGVALAMTLGLAGCNKQPAAPAGPEVPVVEGKYTFYFQLGAESAECPSYAGYFVTGNFNNWATETAPELKNLEGTNYYYAQVELPADYDFTAEKACEYKITMGYNESSGAPKIGVSWSFESDYDKTFPFGQNPQFTVEGKKLNCGTHGWEAVPGPVIKIKDVVVSVTLDEAAPAWVKFTMRGDFNNWGNPLEEGKPETALPIAMTPNADRTVWSYTITETIVAGAHEGQMLMNYVDEEPNWDNKLLGNKSDNYQFSFSKLHETNGYDFNDEDLTLEGDPLDVEFLPDPTALEPITLKVVVVADAAITETLEVANATIGWDGIAMTTTDHIRFEYTCLATADAHFLSNTAYAFAVKGATSGANWHKKIQPANDGKLFKTLPTDTQVTITMKAGGAEYFNGTYGADDWAGLSEELYEVSVAKLQVNA